jgi:hypothetical protein
VGQSAGFDGERVSADADRSALVSNVVALVSQWDGLLAQNPQPGDPRLWQLGEHSSALDQRSRAAGFGGVGHHLSELKRLVEIGADAGQLRAQLEVVREMAHHAAASLGPAPAPQAPPPPDDPTLAPPPLLTMFRPKSGAMPEATSPPHQPPAPVHAPAPMYDPAPTPYVSSSALAQSGSQAAQFGGGVAPPPLVGFGPGPSAAPALPAPEAPPQLHHPVAGAPPTPRIPDPADPLRPDAPSALGSSSVREVGGGFAAAPKPAPFRPEGSAAPGQGPNLLVRSMLGLRAFGKNPKGPGPAEPGASAGKPSLLNLKRGTAPKGHPTPQHISRQISQAPQMAHPQQPREVSRQMSAHHADPAPPPLVNENRSGLPPLPPGIHATPVPGRGSSPNDMRDFVDRIDHARDVKQRGKRGRNRLEQRSGMDFRLWLLAGAGFFGVVIVIVAFAIKGGRKDDREAGPAGSSSAGPNASGSSSATATGALPRSRLLNDNEQFRSLLQQVHGKGKDTPELRALLEEQASIAAQALSTDNCTASAVECAALREMKDVVTGKPSRLVRRKRSGDAWKSKWLAGLKMPDIPVEDDPRVQRRFEFYTENPVGRETFQQMLFRCGAHKDLIQTALIRRNLSPDLLAVVFAESGCAATAKSPAGAEGLWQFIPDAARAYHLRIIEGVVDERHSPAKSTEAAVKYFSDLKERLGEWDLCFAAYNMGPFGLMARIERTGEQNVSFWDLVDSDLIPDETEGYAPGIQAIALILANLQKLKFSAIQMRAPQNTADLDVPPQTRLSMIARAAATSVTELKRLNLDLKSDRTPNLPNFAVQVPKDVVWQARDTLQELVRSKDEADLCVPQSFDWGRQRFTAEMAKACERSLSTGAAVPGVEAAPDLGPADGAPGADPGAAPAVPRPRPRPQQGMPDTPE